MIARREGGGPGDAKGCRGARRWLKAEPRQAAVERGVVDGLDGWCHGSAGRWLRGGYGDFPARETVHVQTIGEFVKKFRIGGFLQDDGVSIGEADDFRQRVDAAHATVEDVVSHNPHAGDCGAAAAGKQGEGGRGLPGWVGNFLDCCDNSRSDRCLLLRPLS